ncbi:dihydrofolate reductase family protein [uncultured Arthrobacter sp.]|uniref:dihydrofolate reductase family protein n=1 Tax=uncultured Arthrobacter sp. TaxID=114050 RepID=UPI0028CFF2D5|nr:dihydrofolate reductase family protein [uncultured Arthrobacter sp.]
MYTFGSGVLIRSLPATDVLDRLRLWLYPITLGQGKRIFDAGTVPTSFRLGSSFACVGAALLGRVPHGPTRHMGRLLE